MPTTCFGMTPGTLWPLLGRRRLPLMLNTVAIRQSCMPIASRSDMAIARSVSTRITLTSGIGTIPSNSLRESSLAFSRRAVYSTWPTTNGTRKATRLCQNQYSDSGWPLPIRSDKVGFRTVLSETPSGALDPGRPYREDPLRSHQRIS